MMFINVQITVLKNMHRPEINVMPKFCILPQYFNTDK